MAELIERLQIFLDEFATVRSPSRRGKRLTVFFQDARPLLRAAPVGGSRRPKIAVDAKQLGIVFQTLSGALAGAAERGQMSNVWAIAGLKRNEVRNAAALGSLWSPGLFPQTAAPFLRAFLDRLPSLGALLIGPELDAGYTVRTEEYPLGNVGSRVDLSIEGRAFLLVVEVKIDAPEGEQQVNRYNEVLQAKAHLLGKRPMLVLLGPRPPATGAAVHASWADVAAAAQVIARAV